MASPPLKPWERSGVNSQNFGEPGPTNSSWGGVSISSSDRGALPSTQATRPQTQPPPPVPTRPSASSSYGSPGYSGYSGYTGYSGYGGGYGGYGGYGSGMYGGGMYSGFGYNRLGYGTDTGSVYARQAEESSRQAFQSIESIVHAFGSISMMLESTYAALYNSFRAVLGVADHFSRMKSHFAQVLSALAAVRTLKWLYRKLLVLLGLRNPSPEDAWSQAGGDAATIQESDLKKKSNWPVLMFFAVAMGGPWLIWRLLSSASQNYNSKGWASGEDDHHVAEAQYDFSGENEDELSFKAGQKINLAPKELQPRMRGWLLGSVDGEKMGIVPANYLKLLGKRKGRKHENQPQLGVTQSLPTQSGVSQSQSSQENLNNAFGNQENSTFLQEETYESAFGSQDTQPKTAEDFLGENSDELGD